jgi:hypothetical protein
MPVEFPKPPIEVTSILENSLKNIIKILKTNSLHDDPFEFLVSSQIELLYPHEVYFMRLDDLGVGNGLKNATATGWRCFIKAKTTDNILIGETRINPETGSHTFCKLCSNMCQKDALIAFLDVAQNRDFRDEDLEGRLLYAPGLRLSALWLNNKSKNGDIFVPLPQIPTFLEGRNYLEAEFLPKIAENAKIAISEDTRTGI